LVRPHRRPLAAAAVLSLVAAAGALAQPALVARVIEVVGAGGELLPAVASCCSSWSPRRC
jgi:ATP-binding cassette subfamily B protein